MAKENSWLTSTIIYFAGTGYLELCNLAKFVCKYEYILTALEDEDDDNKIILYNKIPKIEEPIQY